MRQDALWVFGYGSLVWRPGFPHEERRAAWLRGFARRLWQGSTDHRGVPEAPGRVVTLVPDAAVDCFGVAYRVSATRRHEVLAQLDRRESGGFERRELPVRLPGEPDAAVPALVYIAAAGNPNFLGPAPVEAIARQVRRSRGPSGTNAEYVLELAAALEAHGADDPHVFAVAALLRGS